MIFLFKQVIFRFQVNFPGCIEYIPGGDISTAFQNTVLIKWFGFVPLGAAFFWSLIGSNQIPKSTKPNELLENTL